MKSLFRLALPAACLATALLLSPAFAAETTVPATLEAKPGDPFFAKFNPVKAPAPNGLMLRHGDRLAICGDSITEQKMYSRIMETYLTVCVPELAVTVRQYGWGGETAPGFLARMTNDCLRFKPTVATTCYGMNDHGYKAYEPAIGERYIASSKAIDEAFKGAGVRVVQGSAGCVGPKVPWSKSGSEEMNLNLCELRNLGIHLAKKENVAFADVFWPMFTSGFAARQKYNPDYAMAGKDAVHPDWAGHTVMAYTFLKALGLDGDLGTLTVDMKAGRAVGSGGHEVKGFANGELRVVSRRYPFCASGEVDKDNSIRSAMTLIPFNRDLNRLTLVVKNAPAAGCKVTWGATSRNYSADQLAAGINLADDFVVNPFSEAFAKVDAAVAAKQAYETREIKTLFHGEEGRVDMAATVALTEKVRTPLAAAIRKSFVPVEHSLRLEAQ